MPEILEDLVRRIQRLETEVLRLQTQKVLFDILNANTPAQITANQNDYDPGDYDFLQLTSDASRNISGFSNGYDGRRLLVNAYGTTTSIVLLHNSGLSLVQNRIRTPTGLSITLTSAKSAYFLYYNLFWNLLFYS